MAKERYNAAIECPNCKQSGTLRVSENDYPFMRKLDRSVQCSEGDFEAKMVNESDAEVTCKKCGHVFKW